MVLGSNSILSHVVLLTPFVEETALRACFNQVLKILLEFDFLICEINALSFSPLLVSCLTLASMHRAVITGDTTQEALLRSKAQSWGLRVSTAGEQLYWVHPGLPYSSHHSNCSPTHQARPAHWGWQPAPSRDLAKPYLTEGR